MKYPAIIFDMDGVITDTEPLHKQAELLVCERHGLKPNPDDWRDFQGMTTSGIFGILIDRYGNGQDGLDPISMMGEKSSIYEELGQEGLPTIPGALDFIRRAKVHFDHVALATSSELPIQKLTFDRYDLWPHFDAIVTGDDVRRGKPYPDPYLLAAERLGVPPADCIVLEDSDNGIRAAVAAGCTAIGLTSNFDGEYLVSVGAKVAVDTYDELEDLLRSGRLIL